MKFKKIVFILVGLLLILITVLVFTDAHKISFNTFESIKEDRKENKDLISVLFVNNLKVAYDSDNHTYYYYLPQNNQNKLVQLKFNVPGLKYKIDSELLNLVDAEYNKEYNFIIHSKEEYYESKIVFTNLPTVQINTNDLIEDISINGNLYLTSDMHFNNFYESNIKIRVRGASSRRLPKKSYKIHLYDDKYKKSTDSSIMNMYKGDSYVLDSLYNDPSKIRDAFSVEIWNQIDSKNINFKGKFVEVFINNQYHGIYVFKEPINRTRLNLNKTTKNDNSIIIKGITWQALNHTRNISNIKSEKVDNLEIKYPKDLKYYPRSWNAMLNKLVDYYDPKIKNDYEVISNTFDINNYVEIQILNAFINNLDVYSGKTFRKNFYFYMDSMNSNVINICPWDLDLTFGLYYNNYSDLLSKTDYDRYRSITTPLFEKKSDKLNDLIRDKYQELRIKYLNEDNLFPILDGYISDLNSGAFQRDSMRWYDYDAVYEIDQIKEWIKNRIKVLDKYMGVETKDEN